MKYHYIVKIYLDGVDDSTDLEFDIKEEAVAVMDKVVNTLTNTDMEHGLLKVTDDFVIRIKDFKAIRICELTWYDDENMLAVPWNLGQTTLDDFPETTTVVKDE